MACEREGSSDSDIRDPVPNDFAWLFKSYHNIISVCFNGGPAGRLYKRYVEKRGVAADGKTFYSLPSTSPAYTIGF
ncbi:MAG TPA: DNA-deoxyinosine glycosylase, partial [Ruminiclostridium sp.]|nr:DNA-deoxyinosine glycosylase [Ruminiclostridium sp.]